MWICLRLVLDSNLVNAIDFIPSRLIYFTSITSKCLSCYPDSPTCRLLFWSMSWIILIPHQPCCSHFINWHTAIKHKVVLFLTPTAFIAICRALLGDALSHKYLHLSSILCILGAVWSCFCILCLNHQILYLL